MKHPLRTTINIATKLHSSSHFIHKLNNNIRELFDKIVVLQDKLVQLQESVILLQTQFQEHNDEQLNAVASTVVETVNVELKSYSSVVKKGVVQHDQLHSVKSANIAFVIKQ